MDLVEPWTVVDPDDRRLQEELQRELSRGHPLYEKNVKALARRTDTDDVLFAVQGTRNPYAVVHLTWRHEPSDEWPWTTWYASLDEWTNQCMLRDHAEMTGDA
jgi:hypothetical protein